jgi:hypothetical protein
MEKTLCLSKQPEEASRRRGQELVWPGGRAQPQAGQGGRGDRVSGPGVEPSFPRSEVPLGAAGRHCSGHWSLTGCPGRSPPTPPNTCTPNLHLSKTLLIHWLCRPRPPALAQAHGEGFQFCCCCSSNLVGAWIPDQEIYQHPNLLPSSAVPGPCFPFLLQ